MVNLELELLLKIQIWFQPMTKHDEPGTIEENVKVEQLFNLPPTTKYNDF